MSIYILPNFLSESECAKFREAIQTRQTHTPFTDSGKFLNTKYKDETLATNFFRKLQDYKLPEDFRRPNTLIMTGWYKPGDQFGLHTDTGLFYNLETKEKSRWTLLIYLNTVNEEGATVFYDESWKERKRVVPVEGTAVVFDIDLWHKGEELQTQSKFWIGCEVIGPF